MIHPVCTRSIVLFALLSVAVAQDRAKASIDVDGGKITIDYTPAKIGNRSPKDIPVGTVWRMSKDAALGLTTTVPLTTRNLTLPPGSYKLSARRVSESKWELVIFQGAMVFADKMAHQTNSLRLDEESDSTDDLTIALQKSGREDAVQARIKLSWGKFSLNTRFSVLGATKVNGSLGGKPAVFTFFHLPVAKNQPKLTAGDLLNVGAVQQQGDHGVAYSIHARKQGTAGCDLIFESLTLASNPGVIAANRNMQKRISDVIAQADGERATMLKTRLKQMATELEALESKQKVASALSEKVTIHGSIGNSSASSKNLRVEAKSGDDGVRVAMTFGAKVANFVISDASFEKPK